MEFTELFRNFGSLFETFQWWSLLLIVGVVTIMVPINILLKKVMKDEKIARLRKITAFISVYIVSIAVVALFTAVATSTAITATYLFGAALALGFCSQFVWEIVKIIRDYGFKKFIVWLSRKIDEEKLIKKIATKYSIDEKLVKGLVAEAKNQIKDIDTSEIDRVFKEDTEFMTSIKQRLESVVYAENLNEALNEVITIVKEYK